MIDMQKKDTYFWHGYGNSCRRRLEVYGTEVLPTKATSLEANATKAQAEVKRLITLWIARIDGWATSST